MPEPDDTLKSGLTVNSTW